MATHSLEQLATYGGSVLLEIEEAELNLASEVRNGALALHRYREVAASFAEENHPPVPGAREAAALTGDPLAVHAR